MACPPPARETNPLASTENRPELKTDNPTLVASVAAIACDFCTLTVSVLTAPDVTTGEVPAAVEAPKIFQLPAVGESAPPDCPVIVSPTPVPFIATNPLASTVNCAELK